ncbi:hypothetical protein ACFLZ9_02220 [Patescibacteria group bacterium]
MNVLVQVKQIVAGNGPVYELEKGYRWALGYTKNWWMDKDSKTDEFILAYQYGKKENMENLRRRIIWMLGIEEFNN